jgi:hypothetical protein
VKAVKDVPILMSGPMARAIRDDDKTETRRIVKDPVRLRCTTDIDYWRTGKYSGEVGGAAIGSPYGVLGRRLWVKETYYPAFKRTKKNPGCVYRADQIAPCLDLRSDWAPSDGWKPSIFMPRWACRTELLNRGVTIERLHDITEAGAAAEGIVSITRSPYRHGRLDGYGAPGTNPEDACKTRLAAYERLWNKINGPASWNKNPWVWVIKFERVR